MADIRIDSHHILAVFVGNVHIRNKGGVVENIRVVIFLIKKKKKHKNLFLILRKNFATRNPFLFSFLARLAGNTR